MAGNDEYTKLLLHCDGADGSTSFPDASASAHTVTAHGDAKVSTAQSKFGRASGHFDGSGDWLQVPDSTDFDFGTGSWTVDFWVYPQSGFYYGGFPSVTTYNQSGWAIAFDSTNPTIFAMLNYNYKLMGTIELSLDAWNHVAVVKDASTSKLTIYINGVKDVEDTDTQSWDGRDGDDAYIGRLYSTYDNFYFKGYLDELRVSKGIARWTSDFTPPNAPYSSLPRLLKRHLQRRAYPINRVPPHAIVW